MRACASTDIVVAASHGAIPLALLFDAAVPDRRATLRIARGHRPLGSDAMPALASVTVVPPQVLDKARVRAWLKALPRTILRAKGIVRVADGDDVALRVCQVAARRVRFTPHEAQAEADRRCAMVFIGILDADTVTALHDGLAQCRAPGVAASPSPVD